MPCGKNNNLSKMDKLIEILKENRVDWKDL